MEVTFKLQPGELFIVDNTRVLHARKAFSGTRHALAAGLLRRQGRAALDAGRDRGGGAAGGRRMSRRRPRPRRRSCRSSPTSSSGAGRRNIWASRSPMAEHMLQGAWLAEERGRQRRAGRRGAAPRHRPLHQRVRHLFAGRRRGQAPRRGRRRGARAVLPAGRRRNACACTSPPSAISAPPTRPISASSRRPRSTRCRCRAGR